MTTPHLLTAAAVTLLVLAGGVITSAYLFRDRTPRLLHRPPPLSPLPLLPLCSRTANTANGDCCATTTSSATSGT